MEETTVTTADIVKSALEGNPTKLGDVFNDLAMQRIADAVAQRKQEIAQSMFEPVEDEAEEQQDDEQEEQDQSEADDSQQDDEVDADENTETDA